MNNQIRFMENDVFTFAQKEVQIIWKFEKLLLFLQAVVIYCNDIAA